MAELICGQLSLLDLVSGLAVSEAIVPVAAAAGEPKENYLKRGEKIFSLLRNVKGKAFEEDNFLELFPIKTWEKQEDRGDYARKRIKQALIRPIIESADWFDAETESEFRALFCGYDNFRFEEADSYSGRVYRSVARDDHSWCVMMYPEVDEKNLPYTFGRARVNARKQRGHWQLRRVEGGCVRVMDFGDYFVDMVFLCQAKKYLKHYFAGMDEDALAECVVYRRLKELADAEIKALEKFQDGGIPVSAKTFDNRFIRKTVEDAGYHLVLAEKRRDIRLSLASLVVNFVLSDDVSKEDLIIFGDAAATPIYSFDIRDILDILLDEYSEEKRAEEYRRSLSDSYAKSYMTKKNIPQKMIDAMERSRFNETFGYVEFDEQCDTAKIEEIFKEFDALKTFLKLKEHKNVALRFRKLGNHKASGLYYPSVRCLCVDVKSPSSMAHELFHMLDYEHGELSRTWDFQKCKDLYKQEFNRLARERGTKFTGKYDREYYFQSTEIFARCGEMYLTRVCGIDNSLVKPEETSVAYPWTEELEAAVKDYFDAFIQPDMEVLRISWKKQDMEAVAEAVAS